jgi:hypothetical protein
MAAVLGATLRPAILLTAVSARAAAADPSLEQAAKSAVFGLLLSIALRHVASTEELVRCSRSWKLQAPDRQSRKVGTTTARVTPLDTRENLETLHRKQPF